MKKMSMSLRNLYQDLLDRKIAQEMQFGESVSGMVDGSFVTKNISGNMYWYFQYRENNVTKQRYVGPETEKTREIIDRISKYQDFVSGQNLKEIVKTLKSVPGVPTLLKTEEKLLRSLELAGFFRNGGILIGTHAYRCYPFSVGFIPDSESARTMDVGVAFNRTIDLFVPEGAEGISTRILERVKLTPLPSLDPKGRIYVFAVDGTDLKLEVLTTYRNHEEDGQLKNMNNVGFMGQPLPYMEFLTKEPVRAVILSGEGILTNVPSPDRYAVHKIMVSQVRPEESRAKRAKDLQQAMTILKTMESEYPSDLVSLEMEMRSLAIQYDQENKWNSGLQVFNKLLSMENASAISGLSIFSPDPEKSDTSDSPDIPRFRKR